MRAVALTHKESILFMQRLAALERNGIADGPIKAQYEQVFLDMLYTMCTTPRPDAPEVRDSILEHSLNSWLGCGNAVAASISGPTGIKWADAGI